MSTKFIIATFCLGLVSFASGQTLTCVTCNSSVTPACATDPSSLATAVCSTSSCYTKLDDGVVTRGCTAALATGVVCNSEDCYQCSTNGCNAQQTICQMCNNCGGLSATNTTLSAICQTLNSQCFVGEDGTSVNRRCAQTTDSCSATNSTCQLCTGYNCNNAVYPPVKPNGANINTITTSILFVSVVLAALKLA